MTYISWAPNFQRGATSPADFVQRCRSQAVLDNARIEADIQAMTARASGEIVSKAPGAVRTALPPPIRTYEFKAEGDPMIVVYDETGNRVTEHHYYGPAVVLFFNKHGHLDHIEFVGVCDSFGGNRQYPTADYVGEHARLYVQSGVWQYRNECGHRVAEVSDRAWVSEKGPDWRPEADWIQSFRGQKTFVVHSLQPRVIDGLPFDVLWAMASAKELFSIDFDRAMAHEWVNSMLILVGSAQELTHFQEETQELLSYAVMYGMAMTNSSPGGYALAAK